MASGHRNGVHKVIVKVDRPANLRTSSSFKSKPPVRRSSSALAGAAAHDDSVPGRVRVAVRLRPRNAEESVADADFADCVELQPELKRLKLRKNNWDSDTYQFDEVLTEFASQKRVYEVVAKPVVEDLQCKIMQLTTDHTCALMVYGSIHLEVGGMPHIWLVVFDGQHYMFRRKEYGNGQL